MEISAYIRFLFALVFVLGLIGALSWAAKRYGAGGRVAARAGKGRRLGIVEVATIDARRRVVLLRRDDTEHLVLLGATNDLVIERDIPVDPARPIDPARAAKPVSSAPVTEERA